MEGDPPVVLLPLHSVSAGDWSFLDSLTLSTAHAQRDFSESYPGLSFPQAQIWVREFQSERIGNALVGIFYGGLNDQSLRPKGQRMPILTRRSMQLDYKKKNVVGAAAYYTASTA